MNNNFFKSNISVACGELYMNIGEDNDLRIETEDPCSGDWGVFTLPANLQGMVEAERIIAALQQWIRDVKL